MLCEEVESGSGVASEDGTKPSSSIQGFVNEIEGRRLDNGTSLASRVSYMYDVQITCISSFVFVYSMRLPGIRSF